MMTILRKNAQKMHRKREGERDLDDNLLAFQFCQIISSFFFGKSTLFDRIKDGWMDGG